MTFSFDRDTRADIERRLERFARREPPPAAKAALVPAAVALVVVGSTDGEAGVIVTRRTAKLRSHGGQWALPGGRLEAREAPVDAALRETREEIGLALEPRDVLGRLDVFLTRSRYAITPYVVWGPEEPRLRLDAREVASAHVIPLEELCSPELPALSPTSDPERPLLRLPIVSLETTIFAPTAAMLYQFREVALLGHPTRVAHFEQPRFAWS